MRAIVPVNNVIGYDVVLNYNKAKVNPTGVVTVSNNLINPNYTSNASSIDTVNSKMYISVFFNASAPANAKFSGTGDVFCVAFVKTAGFSSNDTAAFTVASLQESYFNGVTPKVVSPGNIYTYQTSSFTANLKFWFDNSPIKYNSAAPSAYLVTNIYGDNVNCSNLSAGAVQPDLSGNFTYNYSNGININIQKDIPGTTSVQPVINGFDAFLTRRLLINDPTFIPSVYQIIAMDVNTDGVISAGDLSQINQRAILSIPEFKQAWNYNAGGVSNGKLSKDWLFVNGTTLNSNLAYKISTNFPNSDGVGYSKSKVPVVPFCTTVPVQSQLTCLVFGAETYTGILVGDVDGNYATVVPNNIYRNQGSQVIYDLAHKITIGNIVEIPVLFISSESVHAIDFALKINNNISFQSVIGQSADMEILTHFNTDDQTLRFTSYSLNNLNAGKPIVKIRLQASQLAAIDLTSVESFINGERVESHITGGELSTDDINIYPNPTAGLLNVVVSEDAQLQVLSIDGRQVMMQTKVNANEKVEINLQDLANGIYIIKATNEKFTAVKRLVVRK